MQLTNPALDIDILTRDPDALMGFYRDRLGCEPRPAPTPFEGGRHMLVAAGRHRLNLLSLDEAPGASAGATERANGIRLLAFILPDLEAVLARFDAAGHGYERLPLPEAAPFQVAFSRDSDGNALELVGLRDTPAGGFSPRMQIALTVSDAKPARDFYGRILGLQEEPVMKLPPDMGAVDDERYGFVFGGTTLKFWSHGPDRPTRSGPPFERTGLRRIVAHVEDVDALADQLRSEGVSIEVEPRAVDGRDVARGEAAADGNPAARTLSVSDPDGNWIEFRSA